MDQYERCHNGGQAYEAYKKIEPKFTDEFRNLTRELLIETYLRTQFDRPQMSDRDFMNNKNTWRAIADELKVLNDYPYVQDGFPQAHPMAKEAAVEAKRRMGVDL